MYTLYYNLLVYLVWSISLLVALAFVRILILWMMFEDELVQVNFYGTDSIVGKIIDLIYLAEPFLKGDNYTLLNNSFFFIMNLALLLGLTYVIIYMESDLELIYMNCESSEISLFTLA